MVACSDCHSNISENLAVFIFEINIQVYLVYVTLNEVLYETVNYESKGMCEQVVMAYFNLISRYLGGWIMKHHR
jgi:hypothetical protein